MPHSATELPESLTRTLLPRVSFLLSAIADIAAQLDMPLFLVGGPVRDMLLGTPLKDLDLVTEGDASVLGFEISKELGGEVTSYSQFGTCTVKLEGGRFDLATARQETYARPGALPTVTPSTIDKDLCRRDFAINAMALALSGRDIGRLLDPFGGRHDLKDGTIGILHPGSFLDDPTRIFRAIRYEQRLSLRLNDETARLLSEALQNAALDTVSGDRIRREIELILGEEQADRALVRCGELGILEAVYPPLGRGDRIPDLGKLEGEDAPLMYLAGLAYPLVAAEGEGLIRRLNMPSRWASVVRDTVAVRLKSGADPNAAPHIGSADLPPAELSAFLDVCAPAAVRANALLSHLAQVREALEMYLTRLRYVRPLINGRDILDMGVNKGPLVGEVLRELRRARIAGEVGTREEERSLAKEYIKEKGCESSEPT